MNAVCFKAHGVLSGNTIKTNKILKKTIENFNMRANSKAECYVSDL